MKRHLLLSSFLAFGALGSITIPSIAAEPAPAMTPNARALFSSQEQMLQSSTPQLAANKRLVYDFWREVLEAGHVELADKYLTEAYIQHNPNVPTGRAGFVGFFAPLVKKTEVVAKIKAPLISVTAEGDLVTLSFVQAVNDPVQGKYVTTWFDMFRIENGKIAEHWDSALKGVKGGPRAAVE